MRDKILQIKKENPSFGYGKISKMIGCSKNLVKYHLKEDSRLKMLKVQKIRHLKNPIRKKLYTFFFRKKVSVKERFFIRSILDEAEKKIRNNPFCYLTGNKIDLNESSSYHLDHKIPVSRGGKSTLENMGLLSKEANFAKRDKTIEEHLEYCKKVVKNFNL